MESDKIHPRTLALEAFRELAEVLHRADLEAYFLHRTSKPVVLDSKKLGKWGIHSIQTNLFVARNRASKQLLQQIKSQHAQLLNSVKDTIAGTQKPTYCREIAKNLAHSNQFTLFSPRAIQTIVYQTSRKIGAIQNSGETIDPENPLIIGPVTGKDESILPEAALRVTRRFMSWDEIAALTGNKTAESATPMHINRRYAIEAAPGVWVHRRHIDDDFRRYARQAKANLLTVLPRLVEQASGKPLEVARLVDALSGKPVYRIFSPGTLAVLICRFASRNSKYILSGDDKYPRDCRISKTKSVDSVPISICLSDVDVNAPPVSKGQTHDVVENFTPEDLDYLQDKKDRHRSKRNHYRWPEDFSGTTDMHEESKKPETEVKTADAVSTVLNPQPVHTEISSSAKKKARKVQTDTLDDSATAIEADLPDNSQKAFTDFKSQMLLEDEVNTDSEMNPDFQGDILDDPSSLTDTNGDFENLGENGAEGPYIVTDAVEKSTEIGNDLFYTSTDESSDDWEQYVEELDEFEIQAHQSRNDDIRTDGKLSREQRARQVAIEVGQPFGWNNDGIELLTEVFVRYGWSATRRSIESAFEKDLTPEELRLSMAVREFWQEGGVFPDACIATVSPKRGTGYDVLSWPMALALVRLFGGTPDLAEIEDYLNRRFEVWRRDKSLFRQFPAFSSYLYHCIITSSDEMDTGFEWLGPGGGGSLWDDDDPADHCEPFLRNFFKNR